MRARGAAQERACISARRAPAAPNCAIAAQASSTSASSRGGPAAACRRARRRRGRRRAGTRCQRRCRSGRGRPSPRAAPAAGADRSARPRTARPVFSPCKTSSASSVVAAARRDRAPAPAPSRARRRRGPARAPRAGSGPGIPTRSPASAIQSNASVKARRRPGCRRLAEGLVVARPAAPEVVVVHRRQVVVDQRVAVDRARRRRRRGATSSSSGPPSRPPPWPAADGSASRRQQRVAHRLDEPARDRRRRAGPSAPPAAPTSSARRASAQAAQAEVVGRPAIRSDRNGVHARRGGAAQQHLDLLLGAVEDGGPPAAELHPLLERAQAVLERQVALEPLDQPAQPGEDLLEPSGGASGCASDAIALRFTWNAPAVPDGSGDFGRRFGPGSVSFRHHGRRNAAARAGRSLPELPARPPSTGRPTRATTSPPRRCCA